MEFEDIISHIDPEEGWQDVFLKIVEKKELKDSFVFTCKGLYNKSIVGFQVIVKKNIPLGLLESGEINRDAFISEGVNLKSIGEESNMFIKALSELYGFPTSIPFTEKGITATIFPLNEKDADFSKEAYYRFKLFLEEASEERYAELFLNINLQSEIIEFHEKDEEYRSDIISILTDS